MNADKTKTCSPERTGLDRRPSDRARHSPPYIRVHPYRNQATSRTGDKDLDCGGKRSATPLWLPAARARALPSVFDSPTAKPRRRRRWRSAGALQSGCGSAGCVDPWLRPLTRVYLIHEHQFVRKQQDLRELFPRAQAGFVGRFLDGLGRPGEVDLGAPLGRDFRSRRRILS